MEKEMVSVIVAIYSVENFLERCVKCIINQTYRELEIILVDDGSPDRCPQICDTLAETDPRIRVIHKENEGSVYARRDGLLHSNGKYVLFLDGDDYADSEYVEELIQAAQAYDADVVVDSYLITTSECEFPQKVFWKPDIYEGQAAKKLKEKLIYSGVYYQFGINPALWNKLFRRDKLLACYKNVPRNITLGEDFAVCIPYIATADRIVVIDSKANYHYVQHNNSMVHQYNDKLLGNINRLIEYLDQIPFSAEIKSQLTYYYSWLLLTSLKNVGKSKLSVKEKINELNKIHQNFVLSNLISLFTKFSFRYAIVFWLFDKRQYLFLALLLSLI